MRPPGKLEVASYVRPALGHRVGGDLAVIEQTEDFLFLAVVDVLGHGPEAHATALELNQLITRFQPKSDLLALLDRLHQQQQQKRGAVVGLCGIWPASGRLDYVGIGNTTCRIVGDNPHHMLTREGVVGQTMRTPTVETHFLKPRDVLLLYTDGVSSTFELGAYPELLSDAARQVARKVVDRFGKTHDDAACIAVRYP